jgi:signal transduction histidine kinase
MASDDPQDSIGLRIDAQVVRQLGAELITDPEQALIELIKNAYDADADNCHVAIDTKTTIYLRDDKVIPADEGKTELEAWRSTHLDTSSSPATPPVTALLGNIVVENDGPGIDFDTIKDRWLLISGSIKRAVNGAKKTKTAKHRTPIGDKGIGRLGTMRIGDRVEFVSRAEGSTSMAKGVAFRWSSFDKASTLDQVPVHAVEDLPSPMYTTRVAIQGLQEPERWAADIKKFQTSLARLISPFTFRHEMEVSISVNNEPVQLQSLAQDLEQHTLARYSFSFNPTGADAPAYLGLEIMLVGDYFGPEWTVGTAGDFLKYLNVHHPEYGLRSTTNQDSNGRWAYRIDKSLACADFPGFRNDHNPGQFAGRVYSVSYRAMRNEKGERLSAPGATEKQLFKDLSGISIYRNGFGIRINSDWLNLAGSLTSGAGWYALRKDNTVGYIDLDSEINSGLTETSNREGFLDTPAWRQFRLLSSRILQEINEVNDALRRGFSDYRKSLTPPDEQPSTADAAVDTLDRQAKYAEELHTALTQQHKVAVNVSQFAKALPAKQREQMSSLAADFEASVQSMEKLISEGQQAISPAAAGAQAMITDELTRLRDQVAIAYDFIGAGMAAENFAHEVHPIIEHAIAEIDSAMRLMKIQSTNASRLLHLQAARSYVRQAGKYLSTLDPMLRIYRDINETFKVSDFAHAYVRDAAERLKKSGVRVTVKVDTDFSVNLPRGRLMQVFDNVVRNAEYWLTEPEGAKTLAATRPPEIEIRISDPVIVISDNGLGVRKDLEDRIFEMFVSDKPSSEGRGLGLFITKEILNRLGGSIHLDPERNSHGRRFKFEISLKPQDS